MKYKVGDKVLIKTREDMENEFTKIGSDINCKCIFTKDMSVYCGCILEIKKIICTGYSVKGNTYRFSDDMIVGLAEDNIHRKKELEIFEKIYKELTEGCTFGRPYLEKLLLKEKDKLLLPKDKLIEDISLLINIGCREGHEGLSIYTLKEILDKYNITFKD